MENRVTTLEANYRSLEGMVVEIKDNHLAHLADDVKEVNDKFDALKTLLISNLVGVVIGLGMLILQAFR